MAYPTSSDLQTWLTAEGLYNSAFSGSLSDALDAAELELEALVGSRPLIKAASATARRYDPAGPRSRLSAFGGGGRYLRLDAYLGEAPTEVMVGCDESGANGAVLTLWTDYFLEPRNWSEAGLPISGIVFHQMRYGNPGSIKVTGKWGAWTTLPADLKIALFKLAAWNLRNAIAMAATAGGIAKWDDGDVSNTYASPQDFFLGNGGEGTGLLGGYYAEARRAALRYQRVDM